MLKFFRKIRQQLLTENKFSKYLLYAIGEIVLVVIGILLALQVNNWNEHRKERKEEVQILKSVKTEFETNLRTIINTKEGVIDLRNGCRGILQYTGKDLSGLNRYSSDSLIFGAGFTHYSSLELTDAFLKDLLNTGRINLIQNDSLKYFLTNWEKKVLEVREPERFLFEDVRSVIHPFLNHYYSQSHEYNEKRYNYKSGFDFDFREIYQIRTFENLVVRKANLFQKAFQEYENLEEVVHSILSLTDKELLKK